MDSRLPVAVFLLTLFMLIVSTSITTIASEVDVKARVYRVIDGDTFDCFPVGRVRLADINAPELSEKAGLEAREALESLIDKRLVYLDVDNRFVIDKYNRVIAVAYIRINSTHLLNVNKWLVVHGYAEPKDYPNEFNPQDWKLYIYYPLDWEKETSLTTALITTCGETSRDYATIIVYAGLGLAIGLAIGLAAERRR